MELLYRYTYLMSSIGGRNNVAWRRCVKCGYQGNEQSRSVGTKGQSAQGEGDPSDSLAKLMRDDESSAPKSDGLAPQGKCSNG